MRWSCQRKVLTPHLLLHALRIIEANDAVRVIDEQVELLQKILAKNAANPAVGNLYLAKVVDQKQRVFYFVSAGLERVQPCVGGARREPCAGYSSLAQHLQTQLGGELRIDGSDLRGCVQHKVKGPGVIERDGNNEDGMLNNTRAYTGHISRAVRFRIERGNHDDDEDRGREPPEICHGKSPQPGWLGEPSTHVSACCQCKHPFACHDDPPWGISPPECETKVVE